MFNITNHNTLLQYILIFVVIVIITSQLLKVDSLSTQQSAQPLTQQSTLMTSIPLIVTSVIATAYIMREMYKTNQKSSNKQHAGQKASNKQQIHTPLINENKTTPQQSTQQSTQPNDKLTDIPNNDSIYIQPPNDNTTGDTLLCNRMKYMGSQPQLSQDIRATWNVRKLQPWVEEELREQEDKIWWEADFLDDQL